MSRTTFFCAIALLAAVACSSKQDLGGGKSKAGETCANSSDCADGLRCLDSKCGGGDGKSVSVSGGGIDSCASDQACAARGASEPYCKNGAACTECLTDDHCAGSSSGKRCKVRGATEMNFCVACLDDTDCADAKQRCSIGELANFCVDCLEDKDCTDPTRPRCQLQRAVPTDAASGFCVACLVSADCKDPAAPICRNTTCTSG